MQGDGEGQDTQNEKKPKAVTLAGLTALSQALDSKLAHTSFGRVPLSDEMSQPVYGFGTADRFAPNSKLFLNPELAKQARYGKNSPGPIYSGEDNVKYKTSPNWGFGTSDRNTLEAKTKYDFYENATFLDDPISADHTRKAKPYAPKFGTEPRIPLDTSEKTPGPQYYPPLKPEIQNTSKYTFGFRRNVGQTAISNLISTPGAVGPGRYVPEKSSNPSQKRDFPTWTLPKAGRPPLNAKGIDKNQTYDTRSSIGRQQDSKKKNSASAHFGSSTRSTTSRMGTFKDMMATQPVKARISHPNY